MADFNTLPDYNKSRPIGPPKYKIKYLINNDDVATFDMFPVDTNVYATGETAIIQGYNPIRYSRSGIHTYKFTGWSLARGISQIIAHTPGDEYIVKNHDLTLYAQWSKIPTIQVDSTGAMTTATGHVHNISVLTIPEFFGGARITKIGSNAFPSSDIDTIVVPPSITNIAVNAFAGWTGSTIRFIDNPVTFKYPGLTLEAGCFNSTPNLLNVLLPLRWRNATGVLFPDHGKSGVLTIYIRNTKLFMTAILDTNVIGWNVEDHIAAPNNAVAGYTRVIHWGYNN